MSSLDSFSAARPKPLDALIEEARLAALHPYRTLEPREAEALSRLAREAAAGLGATQATVSFVDDRAVWFGGAFGFAGHVVARDGSFCDVVVRQAAPLLVADGLADARFWQHGLVRGEPGVRCYAGVPLIDHGGYALGTVAVYSTRPSVFSPAMVSDLSSLASLVRDFLAESRTVRLPGPDAAPARRVQGWLGVKTLETQDGRDGTVAGLVVLSVARRSPAQLAGIRPTDILQSIGGRELFTTSDVAAAMAGRAVGTTVTMRFRRAGQWQEAEIDIKPRRIRVTGR